MTDKGVEISSLPLMLTSLHCMTLEDIATKRFQMAVAAGKGGLHLMVTSTIEVKLMKC